MSYFEMFHQYFLAFFARLLNQLRAANASNAAVVQDSDRPAIRPLTRPVPRPRLHVAPANIQVPSAAPVTPAQTPISIPANPSPHSALQSDHPDDM